MTSTVKSSSPVPRLAPHGNPRIFFPRRIPQPFRVSQTAQNGPSLESFFPSAVQPTRKMLGPLSIDLPPFYR